MAERRRKWGYMHFRCWDELRETIEKYAKQNGRSVSEECVQSLMKVYGVEEKTREIVLPPLFTQLEPGQRRPRRKKLTAV